MNSLSETDYLLIVTTHSPYSSHGAIEAIEAAMAATNIGKKVYFLFQGKGLRQLVSGQQANTVAHKSVLKKLSALPLYDVEDIFIEEDCMSSLDLSISDIESVFDTKPIFASNALMGTLLSNARHVLVF